MLERGDFTDIHVVIGALVVLWLSPDDPSVSPEENHMPPVCMEVLIPQRDPQEGTWWVLAESGESEPNADPCVAVISRAQEQPRIPEHIERPKLQAIVDPAPVRNPWTEHYVRPVTLLEVHMHSGCPP